MVVDHRAVFGLDRHGLARLGGESEGRGLSKGIASIIESLEGIIDLGLSCVLVIEHTLSCSKSSLEVAPGLSRVILGIQLVSLIDGLLELGLIGNGLLQRDVELV